uniref:Uncharacterized protein n=1 Tax=Anguilla anguilla TaxID=7936 RepID=A0A0E9TXW6_ANGAN
MTLVHRQLSLKTAEIHKLKLNLYIGKLFTSHSSHFYFLLLQIKKLLLLKIKLLLYGFPET